MALVNADTFQAITGPKPSLFLLHIVSVLILICSIALLLALKKDKTREVLFLALALPVGFMAIEIIYRAEIRWVYFLDFAIQAVILALLIYGILRTGEKQTDREKNT